MSFALSSRIPPAQSGRIALVLVVALTWLPLLASAATTNLTMGEAIRLAVMRAPALAARQSQTTAAREEAVRAGALPDPKLILAVNNLTATGTNAFDFAAADMTMKRIGLMQEFPARAKRQARQALADRTTEEAQALSMEADLVVRRLTAKAWVSAWAAQQELDALHTLRDQSALAIRVSKARLGSGIGSAVDTMAIQAVALELDNRIDATDALLEAARGTLARWLDVEPAALAAIGSPPDFDQLPVDETVLLASVDRQGPMLSWQSQEAIAEAQVDLAIADKHPDWSLGASYGQRAGNRSDMLTLEFAIGLPLFTRNRQDRGIAARRAELDAVAASREDARRAQIEAVRRALAQWNGLKRQTARKKTEMLTLAKDRAQTALASYGGGGELQPWLEARRDEIELHVALARQVGELGQAWAELAFLLPNPGSRP